LPIDRRVMRAATAMALADAAGHRANVWLLKGGRKRRGGEAKKQGNNSAQRSGS